MMPAQVQLNPDFSQAERFLTLLDENATRFTFQTFDDQKGRKDRRLASIVHGSLEECRPHLAEMNRRGAGVFVTVNETDGQGRTMNNIVRVRALWHEEDHPCGKAFPLEPHLLIESSPGKYHRYWLVDGMSRELFAGAMQRMVQDYGSDPNARDLARVLRLPGFYHQKDPGNPFMVRILRESGEFGYSVEQTLAAFPPVDPTKTNTPGPMDGEGTHPEAHKSTVTELAARAAKKTHEDPHKGRHAMVLWLGRECAQRGIPVDWAAYAIKVFGALMRQVDTSGKSVAIDVEAELKAFRDAHRKGLADPAEKRFKPPPQAARIPAPVTDITVENQARLQFEQKIAATEDFEQLVYVFADSVQQANLRAATKENLLKQISAKTGVSLGALRADGPRRPKQQPDSYEAKVEKPADFVVELNSRHAVVPVGGSILVLNSEYDPGLKRPLLTFSTRAAFVMRYENRVAMKGDDETDIGTFWLKSPQRRQYDGVIFLPGSDAPGYLNLWTGWGRQPAPGACGLFKRFLFEVIADRDRLRAQYIWQWLAHLFQRPQELPETALILRGGEGSGKNTFVDAIGELVGAHYIQLSSLQQVVGRFQGHLADALLVFANEAIWGGDKSCEGALKHLISDRHSSIERKGQDIVSVPNYKRLIAASNEDWVVPRGRGSRRFVVCDVSDGRRGDYDYWRSLRVELANGGLEALMHELLNADISDFNPRDIPEALKMAGWDMAVRSGNSVQRWWFEILLRGWLYRDDDSYSAGSGYLWPLWEETDRLMQQYLTWTRQHSIHYSEGIEVVGKELNRFGLSSSRPRRDGTRIHGYKIPPLEQARRCYGEQFGIPEAYWSEGEEDWKPP